MKTKFINTAKVLLQIQQKIKYLREQEKNVSDRLKEICDNETAFFDGYKFQKIERIGIINYKDIPQLKNIDLEQYRSDNVVSWKLTYNPQFQDIIDERI